MELALGLRLLAKAFLVLAGGARLQTLVERVISDFLDEDGRRAWWTRRKDEQWRNCCKLLMKSPRYEHNVGLGLPKGTERLSSW